MGRHLQQKTKLNIIFRATCYADDTDPLSVSPRFVFFSQLNKTGTETQTQQVLKKPVMNITFMHV